MQRYKNLAVLLLVLLIVIAGGAVLYKKFYKKPLTKENVAVTSYENTDKDGVQKILSLFPEDVYVDLDRVTENYSSEYIDRNATLSGISYLSAETQDDLINKYQKLMIDSGFMMDFGEMAQGVLKGKKDNDEFGVIVRDSNGLRTVQLVYVDRK